MLLKVWKSFHHISKPAHLFTWLVGIYFLFSSLQYSNCGLELRLSVCEDKLKVSTVFVWSRADHVILVHTVETRITVVVISPLVLNALCRSLLRSKQQ